MIAEADVIGGGSRSRLWVSIIAASLGIPLHRLAEGENGGAFRAARLARMAATGESALAVCTPAARIETILPDPALMDLNAAQQLRHRAAYRGRSR